MNWDYESDFVNIDYDSEGESPMVNIYFGFPMSLNLTVEQALELEKGLKSTIEKNKLDISPQKLSESSENP